MTVARDLARVVVGYGLPGVRLEFPAHALDDERWQVLSDEVVRHRVTGFLVHAIHDGAFPATDRQYAAALEAHEQDLVFALVLERLLLTTVGQLNAADVATRVLKGAAVAHAVYPDPGLRSFADIDVLVPKHDYDTALSVLCADGARRRDPEPHRAFDRRFNRRFGKGVSLVSPGGLEIDLHRMFVAGPFGLAVDTDELFRSSTKFSLGGRELEGLDPEARFVHACYHAALADAEPGLVALRDVAQMVLCHPLDVTRVQELCREWRCGVVVQRAIGLAWGALALDASPPVVQWARAHAPTGFERHALRAYLGPDHRYARQTVAGLYALPGFRAKVAYAATLLVPARPSVDTRHGSYPRRAARAVRLFLHDRSERRRSASADS